MKLFNKMSVYGELDSTVQHMTKFAFKSKIEHIAKVNMPNIGYPSQHVDIEIPHGSRNHVIVRNTVKITFNLDIESTDKTRSVVNYVGRALVKKKVLMLGSKDIDMINNSDIYDTHKNLYLSEEEHKEKLLQGIQLANGLKAHLSATKADDTTLTVKPRKRRLKRRLIKAL